MNIISNKIYQHYELSNMTHGEKSAPSFFSEMLARDASQSNHEKTLDKLKFRDIHRITKHYSSKSVMKNKDEQQA